MHCQKTFRPFKVLFATLDSIILDENYTQCTVYVDRVRVVPYSAQGNEGTEKESDTQNGSQR